MKESQQNKTKQNKLHTSDTLRTHTIISLILTLTLILSSCAVNTHVSSPSSSPLLPTAADTPTAGKTTHRPPLVHSGSAAHRSAVTNVVHTAPHRVFHDHRLAGRCRGEETLFEHVMRRARWGVPCTDSSALHRWCEASSSAGMTTLPVWFGDENKSHKKICFSKDVCLLLSSPAEGDAQWSPGGCLYQRCAEERKFSAERGRMAVHIRREGFLCVSFLCFPFTTAHSTADKEAKHSEHARHLPCLSEQNSSPHSQRMGVERSPVLFRHPWCRQN